MLLVIVPVGLLAGWIAGTYRDAAEAPAPTLPQPVDPILPNLVVGPLRDFLLARGEDGSRRIFFTAAPANVGPGPFALEATRKRAGGRWLVTQQFGERDGGRSERRVPADLVFGGHGHWHVRLGASYRLVARSDGGEVVRRLVKAGFCFFDHERARPAPPGAPRSPQFSSIGCNGRGSAVVRMGLSVGWADPYTWLLPDQRIDVTGLREGDYRLIATVDPDGWFDETDEADNDAWADLRLTHRADGVPIVRVLRRSRVR